MKPEDVFALIEKEKVVFVDLKFNDLPGVWQHFTVPAGELIHQPDLTENGIFRQGIGFDGSSIRGFQEIQESDMILIPDPNTAVIDPITSARTLSLICDVYDPLTRKPYSRDPRYVAKKAEEYLKSTGLADASFWGPEMEFFIFDDVRFAQNVHYGYYFVDSIEGEWNTGREENPNLGYKLRYKEGYFPVPPHDSYQDLRGEMVLTLMQAGVEVEIHHHEVATGGQAEIDMKYDRLTRMADKCMMYKYIVKNVARRHGKVVTFMPKPLFGDNGSGMHTHQSLWKGGNNLFYDPKGYASLSELARYYIGGLLAHAPALMAFCAPTTNSYKRLVPGFEAPVNLVYSMRNRSAAVRIPVYSDNPKSKRLEFRPPDCSCNPYLAFAAMLMAGLDGIERRLDPGPPVDKNTYDLSPEEAGKLRVLPKSLEEALEALEKDHEFLLKGGVFTRDVLEVWVRYKREKEILPIALRPHPYEFHLYFDL
ncbi:MAG: type I glutamate--ammonia ligase [Clostridia bacterium]|jgi:glutamine synthetase|nr:type I glutamate--ammonia ligase [Clostridia bacterium]MDH7573943.1 type I glutamate--ammonia ligase [Clostridia bacterium]